MYGIDCTKEGAQAYYDSLIELYTSWDVDFIKADDMGTWDGEGLNSPLRTDELEALAASIEKFGNKIVLSVSPGAAYIGNAYHLSRHAHMWRISCDFWDNWDALKRQFPRCAAWSKRKVAGHWSDADMLPMGKIGIRGEVGEARNTNFTYDEQITLMAMILDFVQTSIRKKRPLTTQMASSKKILKRRFVMIKNKKTTSRFMPMKK